MKDQEPVTPTSEFCPLDYNYETLKALLKKDELVARLSKHDNASIVLDLTMYVEMADPEEGGGGSDDPEFLKELRKEWTSRIPTPLFDEIQKFAETFEHSRMPTP